MSSAFDMNEFLGTGKREEREPAENAAAEENLASVEIETEEQDSIPASPELDIQKAVVESLAADKASLDLEMESLRRDLAARKEEIEKLSSQVAALQAEKNRLSAEGDKLRKEGESLRAELNRALDAKDNEQPRNPNALALLDREVELPDRFPGETRDHVLEVVREARDAAEKDGRVRRAQILESVLVANEPCGELSKRRAEMEKLFSENGNIVSGPVIEELKRLGIPHKAGEQYLMPAEILKRTY